MVCPGCKGKNKPMPERRSDDGRCRECGWPLAAFFPKGAKEMMGWCMNKSCIIHKDVFPEGQEWKR